jgi:cytochrome c oxidase subunit 3
MSSNAHGAAPYYFVPGPSRHPAMAALGLFFVILGASQWVNDVAWGPYSVVVGLALFAAVLVGWFGDAISESEGGQYGKRIDISFRWSMSWFIFSEVMFFGAFFTALWWGRAHSIPEAGSLDNALLWPGFKSVWPSMAAGVTGSPADIIEPFTTMGPLWLSDHQHRIAIDLGRDLNHRPPCAD